MPTEIHPDAARWGGWHWAEPRHGEHFRRCSFCGSIHPDDLAAEPVWEPQWSDMKYGWPHKFYVPIPNRDPGRLYIVASTHGPATPSGSFDWVAWDNLTPEQLEIAHRQGHGTGRFDPPTWVAFGTHADHFGKFYSIHLADDTISDAVKIDIFRRSGLVFTFSDEGRVSWRMAIVPVDDAPPPEI